jgi:hypothetical protein
MVYIKSKNGSFWGKKQQNAAYKKALTAKVAIF